MSKRAVIPVSMELLHDVLGLPADMEVLHAEIGNFGLTLHLVVTAPDMADVDTAIGCTPPLTPAYYQSIDGVARFSHVDYPRISESVAVAE